MHWAHVSLVPSHQTEQLHGLADIHVNCCICAVGTWKKWQVSVEIQETHVLNAFRMGHTTQASITGSYLRHGTSGSPLTE